MTRLSEWEEFQSGDDLDLGTADLLLDGALALSDVPEGYERIVSLVKSVKQGLQPDEMDWEPPVVTAMMSVMRRPTAARRSLPRVGQLVRPQIAVAIGAVGFLGGGAVAAAAGSLPASVQTVVHSAAASIGVPIPSADPDHHTLSVGSGVSARSTNGEARPTPQSSIGSTALGSVGTSEPQSVPSRPAPPSGAVGQNSAVTPVKSSPTSVGPSGEETAPSVTAPGSDPSTSTSTPQSTTTTTAPVGANGHGHHVSPHPTSGH